MNRRLARVGDEAELVGSLVKSFCRCPVRILGDRDDGTQFDLDEPATTVRIQLQHPSCLVSILEYLHTSPRAQCDVTQHVTTRYGGHKQILGVSGFPATKIVYEL
jgi:hypothetical protein